MHKTYGMEPGKLDEEVDSEHRTEWDAAKETLEIAVMLAWPKPGEDCAVPGCEYPIWGGEGVFPPRSHPKRL